MSKTKLCRTCRYWKPAGEAPRPGYCDRMDSLPDDNALIEICCAVGPGTVFTSPLCGCVLREQKEAKGVPDV